MFKKTIYYAFILVLCLCASGYGQGGNTKGNEAAYKKGLNDLVTQLRRLNNDSLLLIVKNLNDFHAVYQDQASLVYASLGQAHYEHLKANHVGAMRYAINALNSAHQYNVKEPMAEIYMLIGNLHKENTNYPMAFEAAGKALQVAKLNKDTLRIIGAMGLSAMFKRGYVKHFGLSIVADSSIYTQFEALKLAESSPKYERERVSFYHNIAQHYKDMGDYDKAIMYAEKGIALATALNKKRSLTYGYCWLGEAYYRKGNRALGTKYIEKAISISIEIKQPYRTMELYETMANCYRSSGDLKKAIPFMDRYLEVHDSLNVQNNEKLMGELQIKYESSKKDTDLALMHQASELKSKQMQWLIAGIIIFMLLSSTLVYSYNVIRKKNKTLNDKNIKINEQAEKLQTLMQELHHRVKNNLQIVSSLLTLQSNRMADDDAKQALDVSRQRIEAMSIIHSSLYQQDNANMVNMKEFVAVLLSSILESFGINRDKIDVSVEITIDDINVDVAMPLGLIMNEWITNIFKHAFKNWEGRPSIVIAISQTATSIQLKIKDNGIGMPQSSWDNPTGSFGVKMIKMLIKQIAGLPNILDDNGTTFELEIPLITTK
ncbi:histidine kinase dimerization/phosphoacceptor domain -containing protein [Arcicella aquatica]|uniref:histidine kinase n=1 Tax=Arcicella aquatica TaxID=217141 RepID=A0ABU5QJ83_9BACT|nr:histidine kinase dimerization/phosphoacceptor domain -containing protein [Arcicella aquatica]MEA5257122.1 histidine kinase dimerization/phosphoacceptor domain -containing protein [Arcicella aquatica]